MLSLRQHFQRIKEIVDWSWTLAILCMVGYITLGQLAQLYWAMVVFGGLAGSFGLFYDFSCEKLADINAIEDTYTLQKVIATSAFAQDLLSKFAHRNPEVTNQFPEFSQLKNQVSNIRTTSATRFKQRVNRQTQTPPTPKSSYQPPPQKPVKPTTPLSAPPRKPQPPTPKSSYQPPPQKPVKPTTSFSLPPREPQLPKKRATQQKITLEEYGRILNKSDYVYVKPHSRNGHWVKGHYRRKPKR